MDFVVSKVAMSICALIVVGVLGGLIHGTRSSEVDYELTAVLDELGELVESAGRASASGQIHWVVPALSNGEDVEIQVSSILLRGTSDGHSEVRGLSCTVHTWLWDGTMLNSTIVTELDRSAEPIEADSGEKIAIRVECVPVDNESLLMVFLLKAT